MTEHIIDKLKRLMENLQPPTGNWTTEEMSFRFCFWRYYHAIKNNDGPACEYWFDELRRIHKLCP